MKRLFGPDHRQVWASAWPVILANASTPLLGLTDTAILGRSSGAQALAGLALAVLIFNFLFWACGFLRMSTTGFVAQALGGGRPMEISMTVVRGAAIALVLASLMITFQGPVAQLALALLDAEAGAEAAAGRYFAIRIWGAPATLCLYVFSGLLIGLGKTRHLLAMQISLNALNALLDVFFGYCLDWQLTGVAIGTVISEWLVCLTTCAILIHHGLPSVKQLLRGTDRHTLFARDSLLPVLANHRDIFLRTLFMLAGFAWFTNASAQFGTIVLAANHILLQFMSFSAFFLDGFAFVAEARVGQSLGRRNRAQFHHAVRVTTECSAQVALLLALGVWFLGPWLIAGLTDIPDIRRQAEGSLGFAAGYIFCSFAAFQLDGIFIGATRARAMRNASLLALAVFVLSYYLLTPLALTGLWLSFILYVLARAAALLRYWRSVSAED